MALVERMVRLGKKPKKSLTASGCRCAFLARAFQPQIAYMALPRIEPVLRGAVVEANLDHVGVPEFEHGSLRNRRRFERGIVFLRFVRQALDNACDRLIGRCVDFRLTRIGVVKLGAGLQENEGERERANNLFHGILESSVKLRLMQPRMQQLMQRFVQFYSTATLHFPVNIAAVFALYVHFSSA
jgi:hypothetical protein